MDPHVKPSTRRDRAAATRVRILDAAVPLFDRLGYAATTMDAIARDAGVAVQTVYFVFHTKGELLVAALTHLSWGADPQAARAQGWLRETAEAPDGGRRLALAVDGGVEIYRRVAPLAAAFAAASSLDPAAREAWVRVVEERRTGMTRLAQAMATRGELRAALDPDTAAAVIAGLHRLETYLAFTAEHGWPVERFKAWLFAALCRSLLPDRAAAAALAAGSGATAGTTFETSLAPFR